MAKRGGRARLGADSQVRMLERTERRLAEGRHAARAPRWDDPVAQAERHRQAQEVFAREQLRLEARP